MLVHDSDSEYDTESLGSGRSSSPEPADPFYALSGPHVHNEMTLQGRWPFGRIFSSPNWAGTSPYLIETNSDRICFFVRGTPEPQGQFYSLGVDTRGNKHDHVMLLQFVVVSDWSNLTYTTKRFVAHFTLRNRSWTKRNFLRMEKVKEWRDLAAKEKVMFVMKFKYNVDHDFICHEPGHVRTFSCRLAKKRFKKCPPENRAFFNSNALKNGAFGTMQNSRVDQSRALVKLPPFDTLLKQKQSIGELINNRLNWLMPGPSGANIQQSLVSNAMPVNWNGQDLIPSVMSVMARQFIVNFRPQELLPNQEPQEFTQQVVFSHERAQWETREMLEPVPFGGYYSRNEGLPEFFPHHLLTSETPRLPGAPYEGPEPTQQKTVEPLPSCSHQSRNDGLPELPQHLTLPPTFRLPGAPYKGQEPAELKTVEPLPSCSYQRRNEGLPEFPHHLTISETSRLPGALFKGLEPNKWLTVEPLPSCSYPSRNLGLPQLPHLTISPTFRLPGAPYQGQEPAELKTVEPVPSCSYQRRNEGLPEFPHCLTISETSRPPGAPCKGQEPTEGIRVEPLPSCSYSLGGGLPEPPPNVSTASTSRLHRPPRKRRAPTKRKTLATLTSSSCQSGNEGLPELPALPTATISRLPGAPFTPGQESTKQETEKGSPFSSVQIGNEGLPKRPRQLLSTGTSRLPPAPYTVPEPIVWGIPDGTSSSSLVSSDTSSNDVSGPSRFSLPENTLYQPVGPASSLASCEVRTSTSLELYRDGRKRLAARRSRDRRKITIKCGQEAFTISSKVLEDASPVMRAFLKYWTPLPDPDGDILLQIVGVPTFAMDNLVKYLSNNPACNSVVMRSHQMKELARKLMIDINPNYT